MTIVRRALSTVVMMMLATVAPPVLVAQNAPSSSWCFEPRHAARCHGFLITELDLPLLLHRSGDVENTVNGSVFRPQIRQPYNVSLGAMVNTSATSAVGAALFTGGAPSEHRVGAVGRYRRWLGDANAIDISAGAISADVHAANLSDKNRGYGLMADVAVTWHDWIGASVRAEELHATGTTATAAYIGVRIGSYPAVVITGAAVAYALLLFSLKD